MQRADGAGYRPGHARPQDAGRPDRRGRVVWPVCGEPDRQYRPDHRCGDFRRAGAGEPAEPGIPEYLATRRKRAVARGAERREPWREEPAVRLAQRPYPSEQARGGTYPPRDSANPGWVPGDHAGARME